MIYITHYEVLINLNYHTHTYRIKLMIENGHTIIPPRLWYYLVNLACALTVINLVAHLMHTHTIIIDLVNSISM